MPVAQQASRNQENITVQEDTAVNNSDVAPVVAISKKAQPAIKRMSITLSGDSARWLEKLAESQGISQVEALRKALSTEVYIQQEISSGSSILVQKSDKTLREVVFR